MFIFYTKKRIISSEIKVYLKYTFVKKYIQ